MLTTFLAGRDHSPFYRRVKAESFKVAKIMEDSRTQTRFSMLMHLFHCTLQQSVLTISTDDLELGVGWRARMCDP